MYQWIETTVGLVPSGYEWIYGVLTIILYLAFLILLISPFLILIGIVKNKTKYRR